MYFKGARNIPDALIRRKCVNARYTYTGKTWLHYCSELGSSISYEYDWMNSSYLFVSCLGLFDCVRKLLQHGAYFNIKDNNERTPYENSVLYCKLTHAVLWITLWPEFYLHL